MIHSAAAAGTSRVRMLLSAVGLAAAPEVAVLVVSPGARTVLEPTAMMYTFWYRNWYTPSSFRPVQVSGGLAWVSLMAMLTSSPATRNPATPWTEAVEMLTAT